MHKFLSALLLVACSLPAQAQSPVSFPHVPGSPYFYFLCSSTSWELNEKSRLQCEDAQCISLFLEIHVEEEWVVNGTDRCNLLKTDTLDQWNASSELIGAYVEKPGMEPSLNYLEVPAVARFFGHDALQVKYPALGRYRIWLTRARAAFSIRPLDSH